MARRGEMSNQSEWSLARPFARRVVLRGVGGGALALLGGARGWVAGQEATEVGVAPEGGIAWEAIGRIDQNGVNFTAFGYLTYVAGLEEAQLHLPGGSPIARSEATARFTFFGNATLTARSVLENLFVVNAEGEQTFYVSELAGARFDRPESFFSGVPIATVDSRFQNTINTQAPDLGISTGYAEQVQTAAEPFSLDGISLQFGQTGARTRFHLTGQGTRTDAVLPASRVVFSAVAIVVGDVADSAEPAVAETVWEILPLDRLPARVLREEGAETGTLTLTLPEALGGGTVSTEVVGSDGGQIGEVELDGDDLLFTFSEVNYDVTPIKFPLGIELGPARISLDPDQPSTLRVDRQTSEIARDFHWLLTAEGAVFDGAASVPFGDTAESEVVAAETLDDDRVAVRLRTHWTSEVPLASLQIGDESVEAGLIEASADFEGTYILDFS